MTLEIDGRSPRPAIREEGLAAVLRPLLGEINDTQTGSGCADHPSVAWPASRSERAWGHLLDRGTNARRKRGPIREACSRALIAARLGGIDAAILAQGGLETGRDPKPSCEAAVDAVADSARSTTSFGPIRAAARRPRRRPRTTFDRNANVARLRRSPGPPATPGWRHPAGPPSPDPRTARGPRRALLQVTADLRRPPVALMTGADPAVPFLAGLAHHFHNAYLPDSGFAGEELLGDHLLPIMDRFTAKSLAQLPAGSSPTRVRDAPARSSPDADTPEARAFHAADVLDRVLQMDHYAQVSAVRVAAGPRRPRTRPSPGRSRHSRMRMLGRLSGSWS